MKASLSDFLTLEVPFEAHQHKLLIQKKIFLSYDKCIWLKCRKYHHVSSPEKDKKPFYGIRWAGQVKSIQQFQHSTWLDHEIKSVSPEARRFEAHASRREPTVRVHVWSGTVPVPAPGSLSTCPVAFN